MRTRKLVITGGTVGIIAVPTLAGVVYDNGPVNGISGYSNATSGVFGFRRTLLDDFIVPEGGWTLQEMHWNSVGCFPLGECVGVGADISIRSDLGGTPGATISVANVIAFSNEFTGNIFFSREEITSWATFSDITLTPGHYWFEATGRWPHEDFWLTADQQFNECWVNYDDLGGFASGTDQFGVASDINFILGGLPAPSAIALFGIVLAFRPRRRASYSRPTSESVSEALRELLEKRKGRESA